MMGHPCNSESEAEGLLMVTWEVQVQAELHSELLCSTKACVFWVLFIFIFILLLSPSMIFTLLQ